MRDEAGKARLLPHLEPGIGKIRIVWTWSHPCQVGGHQGLLLGRRSPPPQCYRTCREFGRSVARAFSPSDTETTWDGAASLKMRLTMSLGRSVYGCARRSDMRRNSDGPPGAGASTRVQGRLDEASVFAARARGRQRRWRSTAAGVARNGSETPSIHRELGRCDPGSRKKRCRLPKNSDNGISCSGPLVGSDCVSQTGATCRCAAGPRSGPRCSAYARSQFANEHCVPENWSGQVAPCGGR